MAAGRTEDELDDLVGFFVNTLVIRTSTADDPRFTDLLARVRETCIGADEHQDLPFDRLVEALNPVRSTAHHPLYQVSLTLQNTPDARIGVAGAEVCAQILSTGKLLTDVHFDVTESWTDDGRPGGIRLVAHYALDLFEAQSVRSLLEGWVAVLAQAADDPATRVGAFPTPGGWGRSGAAGAHRRGQPTRRPVRSCRNRRTPSRATAGPHATARRRC